MQLAAALICTVIAIADGDTLTACCDAPEGKVNITVRLAEIDAPEKGQAFGNRSKQHLVDVCFEKQAEVRPQTHDRYGRTVARVICDGTDSSVEQVRAGMAWVFDRYVKDRSLYSVQTHFPVDVVLMVAPRGPHQVRHAANLTWQARPPGTLTDRAGRAD